MKRIVIVDYGLGNLRSVYRGLEKSGVTPLITPDIEAIAAADAIVLPGVGAFRDGMEQIGEMQQVLTEVCRFGSHTWDLPWHADAPRLERGAGPPCRTRHHPGHGTAFREVPGLQNSAYGMEFIGPHDA